MEEKSYDVEVGGEVVITTGDLSEASVWKDRALKAEARVQKLESIITLALSMKCGSRWHAQCDVCEEISTPDRCITTEECGCKGGRGQDHRLCVCSPECLEVRESELMYVEGIIFFKGCTPYDVDEEARSFAKPLSECVYER